MRQIIRSEESPDVRVPLSQAVRTGNLLFVSGITPFTKDLQLAKDDFPAQMRQVMVSLEAILRAAGSGFDKVVKTTVILARVGDFRVMNEIYKEYWPQGDFPARTTIEAKLPHPDFLLEIECVAEV